MEAVIPVVRRLTQTDPKRPVPKGARHVNQLTKTDIHGTDALREVMAIVAGDQKMKVTCVRSCQSAPYSGLMRL